MSDSVTSLGKKIVEELNLSESCDTLARWLSHHVAGLINDVETALHAGQADNRTECREAILDLLSHIQVLPKPAQRLMSEIAITEALTRLSPEHVELDGYFAQSVHAMAIPSVSEDIQNCLKTASLYDQLSRRFIRLCLSEAAKLSLDQDADWVKAVDEISHWDHRIISRIRLIAYGEDLESQETKQARETTEIIEKRDKILNDISAVRRMCDALEASVLEKYQITSKTD